MVEGKALKSACGALINAILFDGRANDDANKSLAKCHAKISTAAAVANRMFK